MEKLILSDRYKEVLAAIISDYLSTADPVGSKIISSRLSGNISPATIRQVMASLMEMGFLYQTHTSAGRMPTINGLRYYVENILNVDELQAEEQEQIKKQYNVIHDSDLSLPSVLSKTSKLLSSISRYVGLVVAPDQNSAIIKHFEFIPLGLRRVLGIFVTPDGQVYNKVIEVDEDYTYPELEKLSNFCNKSFSGLSLEDAKKKVSHELESKEIEYDKLIKKALIYSELVFSEVPETEVMIDGETNLLEVPEFKESGKLKNLMKMLDEKRKLLHILGQSEEGKGVRLFIGSESSGAGSDFGIISAKYSAKGKMIGTIGVIGPSRMDYGRVIPIVNFTAKLIGDIITRGKVAVGGNEE